MKEITFKVPDSSYEFFLELVKKLGYEINEEVEIPEEQKFIVRERIKNSNENPERLLDWEKIQDKFKLDLQLSKYK